MVLQIMINTCHGGFGFSELAKSEYKKRKGCATVSCWEISRTDPVMIQIVREIGAFANGPHSNIKLEELDDKYANHYVIKEYDGSEWIETKYDRHALDSIRQVMAGEAGDKLEAIQKILEANAMIHEASDDEPPRLERS